MSAAVAPVQDRMPDAKGGHAVHSAAYRALMEADLICDDYQVKNAEDLSVIKGDWDVGMSYCLQCATVCGCCGCCVNFFTVNSGCVRKGTHANGENLFFGPGVHIRASLYATVEGQDQRVNQGAILNGTKAIITVTQGFVGLAMDRGHPVLLPPGLHQWDSPTLEWSGLIDLATNVIRMGPYTLVTVDQGYAAVTQDNGQQKILEGGKSYMLTHRNWKFEHFITQKIQTDTIGPFNVSTGDNVPLQATATVNWIVEDPTTAARMGTSTIAGSSQDDEQAARGGRGGRQGAGTASHGSGDVSLREVREDVIRQVTASLAAFVGSVRYGVHGNAGVAANIEGGRHRAASASASAGDAHGEPALPGVPDSAEEPEPESRVGRRALFDPQRMTGSVEHANNICSRYGVKILSINLISASPADGTLIEAMSKGAVAAVAAEQTEITAKGQANAMLITAKAEAEAQKIRASGDAAAEQIRAEGSLLAAKRLEDSEVAVAIAKIRAAGSCLAEGKANSFFFGLQNASDVPAGLLGSALAGQVSGGGSS